MLVFCGLIALAAALFCWEFSAYRRWLAANRNPREGVLLSLAQGTRFDFMSAFEAKSPALIREELSNPPSTGGARIHFICPISREGNFLMVYFFRNSQEWWICAIPVP